MDLTIQNVGIRLDDFSLKADLKVNSGELVTLLGPSGCGKTTLLKIIAGLHYPDRGKVFLGKRDVTPLDPRFRKIGMVFQDYALFPHMNIQKNICYGMKEKGVRAENRTRELLKMVQLEGYEKRKIEELSGGEKQRVALARALASSPDLLLLDEPLSALDAQLRRSLRRQIREIQQQTGITAVYVTHDQEEAMAISDRIVLMDRGRISQIGKPSALYSRPDNAFAGSFIGSANMIPVKSCEEKTEGILRYKTPIGDIDLPSRTGRGSYIYFHPEDCRIATDITERTISGEGRIVYAEYGGDFQYLEAAVGEGIVKIKSRDSIQYDLKDTVSWYVKPGDCLVLK